MPTKVPAVFFQRLFRSGNEQDKSPGMQVSAMQYHHRILRIPFLDKKDAQILKEIQLFRFV